MELSGNEESKKNQRKMTQQDRDLLRLIKNYNKKPDQKAQQSPPKRKKTHSSRYLSRWGDIIMEQVVATKKANDRNNSKMRKRESSRNQERSAEVISETSHDNVEVVANGFKVSAIKCPHFLSDVLNNAGNLQYLMEAFILF